MNDAFTRQTRRRDFLKLCGLAGLGLAAPLGRPAAARAAEELPYAGPF